MSNVHVCLVSEQPIPNITTVLQFKPDAVILLTSKEMKERAGFISDVLRNKGFNVEIEMIEAYDVNNVIEVSERVISRYKDFNVSLNITGGTKIGTLGTFQAFYTKEKNIYYVDTKDNKILKLFPEKEQAEYSIEVAIAIKDYLAVYGFMVDSRVNDDSYVYKRKNSTNYLANIAVHNDKAIAELNKKLHEYNENSSMPIQITISQDDNLLKYLNGLDGIKTIDRYKIEIHTRDVLRYLKGIWLEEYVYMIAKDLRPDDVWLNVKGKWVTKSRHSPKNEFDVMISKGNRLFYISCKTANPDRKTENADEGIGRHYLYELDSLSDKALGLFGKKMLTSARRVDDPAVRERANILEIDLIDGRNINTLKESLRQWLAK